MARMFKSCAHTTTRCQNALLPYYTVEFTPVHSKIISLRLYCYSNPEKCLSVSFVFLWCSAVLIIIFDVPAQTVRAFGVLPQHMDLYGAPPLTMGTFCVPPQSIHTFGSLPQEKTFVVPPDPNALQHRHTSTTRCSSTPSVMPLFLTCHKHKRTAPYSNFCCIIWHSLYWSPPNATFFCVALVCFRHTIYWDHPFRLIPSTVTDKFTITWFTFVSLMLSISFTATR